MRLCCELSSVNEIEEQLHEARLQNAAADVQRHQELNRILTEVQTLTRQWHIPQAAKTNVASSTTTTPGKRKSHDGPRHVTRLSPLGVPACRVANMSSAAKLRSAAQTGDLFAKRAF